MKVKGVFRPDGDKQQRALEKQRMEDLTNALKPLIWMFWILGVDLRWHRNSTGRNKLDRVFISLHYTIGLAAFLMTMLTLVEVERLGVAFQATVGDLVFEGQAQFNFIAGCVAHAYILIRRRRIADMLGQLVRNIATDGHYQCPKAVATACRKIRVVTAIVSVTSLSYLVLLSKTSAFDFVVAQTSREEAVSEFNNSLYKWIPDETIKKVIYIENEMYYAVYLMSLTTFYATLFCVVLLLLIVQVDHLRGIGLTRTDLDDQSDQRGLVDGDLQWKLREFTVRHNKVHETYIMVNKEFGFLFFTWVTGQVLAIICLLRSFAAMENPHDVTLYFSMYAGVFILLCYFNIAANTKMQRSLRDIRWGGLTEIHLNMSEQDEEAAEVAATTSTISKHLIQVSGTILTYVLLLYDK